MDKNLAHLNPSQLKAVTLPLSPSVCRECLIMACAGSGKTRVLTHRVSYLLDHGVPADSIVAITFTRKAADSMRQRAQKLNPKACDVQMTTFHSLCADILRTYFRERPFVILDRAEQFAVWRSEIKQIKVAEPDYTVDLKDFNEWIGNTRSNCKDPLETAMKIAGVSKFSDLKGATGMYRDYALLTDAYTRYKGDHYLDFDDLIEKVVELLKEHPSVRKAINQRIKYLLIDEFQDTNTRQFEFLSLIRGDDTQRVMVGDEDQLIYSFRGARIKYIMDVFHDVKSSADGLIMLLENYRCSSRILTLANKVISPNTVRAGKESKAVRPLGQPVIYRQSANEYDEADDVVRHIKNCHASGVAYDGIGVLFRVNAIASGLENALIKAKIPYKIYDGLSLFDRLEVRILMNMLWVASRPDLDLHAEQLFDAVKIGVGDTQFQKWNRERRGKGMDWLTFLKQVPLGKRVHQESFEQLIKGWSDAAEALRVGGGLCKAVNAWISSFDIFTLYKADEREARSLNVETFIELLEDYEFDANRMGEVVTIESFQEARLLNDSLVDPKAEGRVHLMSVHRSKGLEFDAGCIVGMQDGVFPRSTTEGDALEEERRAAYVAISRFMDRLMITATGVRRRAPSSVLSSCLLDPFLHDLEKQGAIKVEK